MTQLLKNPCFDQDRATHALNIAKHYQPETPDQVAWVMDQMVRALTYCPVLARQAQVGYSVVEVEYLGESQDYQQFLANHPNWDKGIPP